MRIADARPFTPRTVLAVTCEGVCHYAHLHEGDAARALTARLTEPLFLAFQEGEGCKVAVLPQALPGTQKRLPVRPGDLVAAGARLILCLAAGEMEAIPVARIERTEPVGLFADGARGAQLYLEWSE